MVAFALALLLLSMPWRAAPAWADHAHVPGLIGYWALEHNDGVVQIYDCGQQTLCGALVGIELDHASDPMPMTWDHRSQCRFVLIRDLKPHGDAWDGTIINPKNGHHYGARLSLASQGVLKVRGYLLFAMLGQTQSWTRFPGMPPADCRMTPADFSH